MINEQRETSLEDAVEVTQIGPSTFTSIIRWDWSGMIAAHGGVLVSLAFSAGKAFMNMQYSRRDQPDPIAAHIQVLFPVLIAPVTVVVKELNMGVRVSVIQVNIQQPHPKTGEVRTCVLGILTQGNLSGEKGICLPTQPSIPREHLPSRKDCEEMVFRDVYRKTAPVIFKNRIFQPKPDRRSGPDVREYWYCRTDGFGYSIISLGQVLDAFAGAPSVYFPGEEDVNSGVRYPTLSMTSEIKKDPNGAEWLFLRIRTHKIRNGRFDTEVYVVDEEGDLVAVSKHVSLINEKRGSPSLDVSKALKL